MDTSFPLSLRQILSDLNRLKEDGATESFFTTLLGVKSQEETSSTFAIRSKHPFLTKYNEKYL
jgi:hypothetical protein